MVIQCNQIQNKKLNIQVRRDIEHNPHKYMSNTSGGVQTSGTKHLIPTVGSLISLFSR